MKLYGLTGGIGSGKSTVSKMFEKARVPVISADYLNLVSAKQPHIKKQIVDRFGTMDRMELRKIIFADMQAKKDMEAIMHPEVQALFFKRLEELAEHEVVIYDSALIFELNQDDMFEAVIVVQCPEEKRIRRILGRDNMNEEIARNIIACQVSDKERCDRADYTVRNEGTIEDLEEAVNWLMTNSLQISQPALLPSPDETG